MGRLANKIHQLKNWVNKEYEVRPDISINQIIKVFVIIVPTYSLVYLNSFFGKFGVEYFIYFNTLDHFKVFYENIYGLIVVIIELSLCLVLITASRKIEFNKWNRILIISIIIGIFIYYFVKDIPLLKNLGNNRVLIFIILGLILLIFSLAIAKSFKSLLFSLVSIFLLSSYLKAEYDYLAISMKKPSFDIILNDGKYLLEENSKKNSYYIGNTTSYLFVYDGTLKKIRAVNRSEIKEFRFKKR